MAEAPEVQVKAGGSDVVTDLAADLLKVELYLNLNQESTAVIELLNCYDLEGHGIRRKVKAAVVPGSKVEIFMGYSGTRSQVFSGYADVVELEAGEEDYVLRIRACDVVKLMKENRRCRIFKEQSYSEVFSAVLGSYSGLCAVRVDDTTAMETVRAWHQNGSDYDFIVEELVRGNGEDRDFYVSLGTAYYTEQGDSSAAASLTPDSGVIRFCASMGYLSREVKVQGCSGDFARYGGQAAAESSWKGTLPGTGTEILLLPSADTQDKAQACADRYAQRLEAQALTVKVTLPGNEALLAGGYVALDEFDAGINGTYRVEQAVHRLDDQGYRTELVLSGKCKG